ncbi:MAG: mechanosensitive ion channel [Pyrinomonadaceae bacterium]|nr:mechanosensitive ion channel [Pyrinomonadaceae bacterium]
MFFTIALMTALIVFGFTPEIEAQLPAITESESTPVAESSPQQTPTPEPTPIPVSEINALSEDTKARIEVIKKSVRGVSSLEEIRSSLKSLNKDLDTRTVETRALLAARPSLETLKKVEQDWQFAAKQIPSWKTELEVTIAGYVSNLKELENLGQVWNLTLKSLNSGRTSSGDEEIVQDTERDVVNGVPEEILVTARSTISLVRTTEKSVREQKSDVLLLQSQVIKTDNRAEEVLKSIGEVRDEALSRLFERDSQPIWSSAPSGDSVGAVFAKAGNSYRSQLTAIGQYLSGKRDSIVFHVLIFLGFAGFLFWARSRLHPLVESDPELKPAFAVFNLPIASALILAIMLSGQFYPQAPRMLIAILGAAALIPGVLYLRRILEKPVFPILNVLLVLYLVDLLRQITESQPLLARLIFTAEMIGAVAFLFWFLWQRPSSGKSDVEYQSIFKVIRKITPFAIGLLGIALVTGVFGFVNLSRTIGNSVLSSAYSALLIYATIQILKSLTVFALRIRPLSELGMVNNYRSLIKNKVFTFLKWIGIISWILFTLNLFSIRQDLFSFVGEWLSTPVAVGSLSFSASDILVFGFTIWLSFAISRLIRFVLNEDVYPRVELGSGLSYAISTILHYVLLLVGLLLAIAAIGVDLTKFTILAGAFGVGLGFGMQAIVNNFVSGLILLFERPVKVDDFVQVGTHQGELTRIGLRASVLRTLDGSEVILPNGQLISEEVTNWTFSDRERRLEINVGVAYGTDPREVMAILEKVGVENEDTLADPPPRVIFVGFGDSSLDFQLRAWTDNADQWAVVRSDLTLAIHDGLEEAGIEIPFPQRDLHFKSIDEKTLKAVKPEK